MTEQNAREVAEVVTVLPLSRFLVVVGGGVQLTAVLSRGVVGRGRPPSVKVGDRVVVERSPYDPGACRIVALGRDA